MAEAEGVACIANIGRAGRQQRLLIGLVGLMACTLASIWLVLDGASWGWRLALVVPWWISALGIFQAKEQTCVALASRGLRELGGEPEAIPPAELGAVRRQARRVYVQSFIAAAALTAVSLVPSGSRAPDDSPAPRLHQ